MAENSLTALLKQVNEVADKGLLGGAERDLRSLNKYKASFGEMAKQVKKAFDSGMTKQGMEMIKTQQKVREIAQSAQACLEQALDQMAKAQTDQEKAIAQQRLRGVQEYLDAKLKGEALLLEAQQKQVEGILENYKKNAIDWKKSVGDQLFEMKLGKTVESSFGKLQQSLQGLDGIGSTIESAFAAGGAILASKIAKKEMASGGVQASGLRGMSKLLLGVGAAVGGIFALVKAFQAIEGAGKKVNKELIQGSGALDLMVDGSHDLEGQVDSLRKTVTSYDFGTSLGMSSEEVTQTVGSLAKMDLSIRNMGGSAEALYNTMRELRQASVSFGISMDDAGGYASRMRLELGQSAKNGQLVSRVGEEFKVIRDLALQSGYSAGSFFAKMKDLTEQVGKFNLRTEETGKILVSLKKVLGKASDEFVKGLVGAFQQESYTDRLKRLMTTDKTQVDKALEASAKGQAREFAKNFLGEKSELIEAFSAYGLGTKGMIDTDQLRNMDEKTLQALLGELQLQGDAGQAAARQLLNLKDAVDFNKRGNMSRVRALGQAGTASTLRVQATQVASILGEGGVRGASLGQLKLLKNLGLDQSKIEEFGRVIELKAAEFKSIQAGGLTDTKELEKLGVEVRDGKIFNKETQEEVTDVLSYLQAQGASFDESLASMESPSMEALLLKSINATQTSSDRLGAYLGEIMQNIYGVVQGIFDKIFGSQSEEAKMAQEGARQQIQTELSDLRESAVALKSKIREEEGKAALAKTPEEREAAKTRVEEMKAQLEAGKVQMGLLQEASYELNRTKTTSEDVNQVLRESKTRGLARFASKGTTEAELADKAMGSEADRKLLGLEKLALEKGFSSSRALVDAIAENDTEGQALAKEVKERLGLSLTGDKGFIMTDKAGVSRGGKVVRGEGLTMADGTVIQTGTGSGTTHERLTSGQRDLFHYASQEAETLDITMPKPNDPDERKRREEAGKEQAKAFGKDKGVQKTLTTGTAKGILEAEKRKSMVALTSALSSIQGFDTTGSLQQLQQRYKTFDKSSLDEKQQTRLTELFSAAKGFDERIEDGLIYKDGRVVRISDQDNVLAFKDGGAGDPRRGGGGSMVNHFHFTGGPDLEMRVKNVWDKITRQTNFVVEP